jgi:hypothetical protein
VLGKTVAEAAKMLSPFGPSIHIQTENVLVTAAPETIVAEYGHVAVTIAVPPAAPCRATQLAAAYQEQPSTGNQFGANSVRNTSSSWCSLEGRP